MSIEDAQLVDQFLNGDSKAFSAIVDKHRGRLTKVARRYTRNETDAQDIVQEAFFKAARSMDTFRRDAKLSTWLHRIVMNTGYDFVQKDKKRDLVGFDAIDEERDPTFSFDPTSRIEVSLEVAEALHSLSEPQRDALLLTEVAGYSALDAASILGVAPGTIKSRRARAKEALKSAIS
ncbi:sigma-70 family RNA polymerase sigma factor [Corynebacterium incognita]|uniref:Sigma-70 family RNA polymerase sigma factor n=1 Tax=Corynebacterium incognita TaxID=2754725 RepID=A0A7G7CLZ5_9CORY|nr:sigma-70 family RNA polymerase sigma factor [Corynebacterium incognita]QNE88611.1 sigma-70 family RNA polymerase sigma factor [Corynebacterium incognita]